MSNLTPEQKNASQSAMRSLENIKEKLTSEDYRLICNGLQVPFTMKKPNSEVWRCEVFQAVMSGFWELKKGLRETQEHDANGCLDIDETKAKKFKRIFYQPKLKRFCVNIQFGFIQVPEEHFECFPPTEFQPVLREKKAVLPVPDVDEYQESDTYKETFKNKNWLKLDDGTTILIIEKVAEVYDDNLPQPHLDSDSSDEE